MNWFYLISCIVATLACIGHFVIGYRKYLTPVLLSDADMFSKRTALSLYHYMSVWMVITAVVMMLYTFDWPPFVADNDFVAKFIGLVYAGFAFVNLLSAIKVGIFRLFQWIFWALISIFAFLG